MTNAPAHSPKPGSWGEFIVWATDQGFEVRDDEATKRHFDTLQVVLLNDIQKHPFFTQLSEALLAAEERYKARTSNPLLLEGNLAEFSLQTKSYASTIDKAYRHNVAWNGKWPKPPKAGWVLPTNWHSIFDDLLRGTIVCKYIDGPEAACEAMKSLADKLSIESEFASRQLDEGYYAYHFYAKIPAEISDIAWKKHSVDLKVEVQVTTQLQEAARRLTHEAYAEQRSRLERDRDAWKWEHASDRFRAGYIAHTLHLIEGLIVELRDRRERKPDAKDVDPNA